MLEGDRDFRWQCKRMHSLTTYDPCPGMRSKSPALCGRCEGSKRVKIDTPINPCSTPECNNEIKFVEKKLCGRCYHRTWKQNKRKGDTEVPNQEKKLTTPSKVLKSILGMFEGNVMPETDIIKHGKQFFRVEVVEVRQEITYTPVTDE